MGTFDISNPYKVTIEEREREIELMEKKLQEISKVELTEVEKLELLNKKEAVRKKTIFDFYKEITGKVMTDEEYKNYIKIFEDPQTRRGYNIKNFIEGDKGRDGSINKEAV